MENSEKITILKDIVGMNTVAGNEILVADYLEKFLILDGLLCAIGFLLVSLTFIDEAY